MFWFKIILVSTFSHRGDHLASFIVTILLLLSGWLFQRFFCRVKWILPHCNLLCQQQTLSRYGSILQQ
jgi:hypothetical protein